MNFRYLSTRLGKGWDPSFEQTRIPFTQRCIVSSLIEIGQVVLEKKIFINFVNVFCYFVIIFPLEKGETLHSAMEGLCQFGLK